MSKHLSEFQNATVGMMVGVIEVSLLQPLNYMKNMTQIKQPISFNPAIMYRGVTANAINMGSCTMIQFAVGGRLRKIVHDMSGRDKDSHLTLAEEIFCGIGAGTTSALVGSPLELIMIQQQKHSAQSVANTVARITTSPPDIYRGFNGMAVREALWTCGYLSIPPVVRRELMTEFPDQFPTNDRARIPAALLGGLFACYLTHPFDTIKTCMQGDIARAKYGTFSNTFKTILAGSMGFRGFYRGATFRYARMCCAVFIMDFMGEKVGQLLYPSSL